MRLIHYQTYNIYFIYFLFSPILTVEVDAMLSSEFKDPATDDDGRVGARTLFWITAQLEFASSFALFVYL